MKKKNKGTSFQYLALALVLVAVLGASTFASAKAVKVSLNNAVAKNEGSSTSTNVSSGTSTGTSVSIGTSGSSSVVSISRSGGGWGVSYTQPKVTGSVTEKLSIIKKQYKQYVVKASWDAVASATGYQGTITGPSGVNTVTFGFTTTSPSIQKTFETLKTVSNASYTIQIRPYFMVDGEIVYGAWTDAITIVAK